MSESDPETEVRATGDIAAAAKRLSAALATLESAVSARLERDLQIVDAEAEIQRMGADRSRLAVSLDEAEARAQRLEQTNREVSRRLIGAMEAIRSILDRES